MSMTERTLQLEPVETLRATALLFDRSGAVRKARALKACAACGIVDAEVLIAYHDCLLCLLAYPVGVRLRIRCGVSPVPPMSCMRGPQFAASSPAPESPGPACDQPAGTLSV
jgi:hypothetical protein